MNEQEIISQCQDFERWVVKNKDDIKGPVYLSWGQEHIAAHIHTLYPNAMVFPQHRCHSWYIAYGGDIQKLKDELLGLDSGCSFGNGGSNCIQSEQVIAHNGLMGGNACMACGYALQTGRTCVVQLGDGSAEEDYVLAALGFAATHKLPILFVVEDNGLAVLTPTSVRRSWKIEDVARGFGLSDDINQLPALLNIKVERKCWHVGAMINEPEKYY